VFASAGDSLGQQPYRINLQAQYNWRLMDKWDAYVRGDYTYTPHYTISSFGQANYTPDASSINKTEVVNFRAGMTVNMIDVNVFVNNVFNSKDGTPGGGRTGCVASSGPSCTAFTQYSALYSINTFRPREIGLQGTYRF
jgi:hypothetical protein